MSQIFITKPGQNINISSSLSKKIDEAMGFIKSIENLSQGDVCHICGKKGISKEHTPSRKAFNAEDIILLKVAKPLQPFIKWEPQIIQGEIGLVHYVLIAITVLGHGIIRHT